MEVVARRIEGMLKFGGVGHGIVPHRVVRTPRVVENGGVPRCVAGPDNMGKGKPLGVSVGTHR